MDKNELDKILNDHTKWLSNKTIGKRANLRGSDLRYADLRYANLRSSNLRRADLRSANFSGADLRGADLRGADLRGADFSYADLRGADLRRADLRYANFSGANLRYADLRSANLRSANLRSADLRGADLPDFQICPEQGDFIAFKKVYADLDACVLKIRVVGLRTSSLVGRKCRTNRSIPLQLYTLDGYVVERAIYSCYNKNFTYEIGKPVEARDYNDDTRIECAPGIHFFMTFKEAANY